LLAVVVPLLLAAQTPDDLGAGAPLGGPSAADLGALPPGNDTGEPPSTADGDERAARRLPPAVVIDKASRLRAEVDGAIDDLRPDRRALQQHLDGVAALSASDSVYAGDPPLKALHRFVRVRAAALAGRVEDADVAVREAARAVDAVVADVDAPTARRLRAGLRFASALVVEARARAELSSSTCGAALGLRRLVQDESRRRRRRLDEVAAAYAPVARGDDRFWARRAAFQVAVLYDDLARRADPGSLRTAALPNPYALEVVDTGALVDPALHGWLGEIRHAYDAIVAAVDARDPDAELATRARERAAQLARFTPDETARGERVENPWQPAWHDGLVRVAERPERRNPQGRFVPVETRAATAAMEAALAVPGTVDFAYAVAGLARLAPGRLPIATLVAALSHSDDRVVVAGLTAVADVVAAGDVGDGAARAAQLREAVVAAWARAPEEARRAPFRSVQRSLYGRAERALLALAAIARVDRDSAAVLAVDERLPVVERAWILADLADPRFAEQYAIWAGDKNERVAGLATWAALTAGRKAAAHLARPQVSGLVGCASRAAVAGER
jgi:hypothetical protein